MDGFDILSAAARKACKLPDDWHGYLFTKVEGQGVMVKGLVVTERKTRGPRKGDLNFRKGDKATERAVFVSHAAFDEMKAEIGEARQ